MRSRVNMEGMVPGRSWDNFFHCIKREEKVNGLRLALVVGR